MLFYYNNLFKEELIKNFMNVGGLVNTGFWLHEGAIWGPIESGKHLVSQRQIIISESNGKYSITDDGRILNPRGEETGFCFDGSLHIYGPTYGKLPWMKNGAPDIPIKQERPEDYGFSAPDNLR